MENEELQSKKRAIELYGSGKIDEFEVGTTEGLKQIHRFVFQDVFDFAGEVWRLGHCLKMGCFLAFAFAVVCNCGLVSAEMVTARVGAGH